MAKTSLPKDPKALAAMVERLMAEADERDAQMAEREREIQDAQDAALARILQAEDRAARATAAIEQMTGNRDHWVARVERAEALVAKALESLRGIEPEPEDPQAETPSDVKAEPNRG